MSILRTALLATTIVASLASAPAIAQSSADQQRFDQAQQRFDREYQVYRDEVQRYRSAQPQYRDNNYRGAPPPNGYADDRYENGYDPARYYRDGNNYQERALSADERVYRGQDGRYYCKRSDGTTGLIAGGAAGGILGNVIDGGHSRTVGTLLGGALGALAGRAIEKQQSDLKCR